MGERGERKLWKERKGEGKRLFLTKFFAESSSKTTPPKQGLIEIPSSFLSFLSLPFSPTCRPHIYSVVRRNTGNLHPSVKKNQDRNSNKVSLNHCLHHSNSRHRIQTRRRVDRSGLLRGYHPIRLLSSLNLSLASVNRSS